MQDSMGGGVLLRSYNGLFTFQLGAKKWMRGSPRAI